MFTPIAAALMRSKHSRLAMLLLLVHQTGDVAIRHDQLQLSNINSEGQWFQSDYSSRC